MSQFSSFYEVNVLGRALICFQNHAHKSQIKHLYAGHLHNDIDNN